MKKTWIKNWKSTKLKTKNGLSIFEVLVTFFIFALLSGGLSMSMIAGNNAWLETSARNQLQQDLRNAMNWMKYDLRQAGPSSITDVPSDGTWYDDITFKIPSGVSGGTLQWATNDIQFVIGGTNSDELHRVEGSTTQVVSTGMKSISFRRQSSTPYILEIALVGERDIKNEPIEYTLNFNVQIRN